MTFTIREFSDFDVGNIYDLVSDVYATSEGMSEALEDKYPMLESFQQDVADLLSRPGAIALVAEREGTLLGYLTVKPRNQAKLRHTSELNMGVHHLARGQGVGKALLVEALRQAEESAELEIIYLMVRADNTSAVRLYETMGFEKMAILDHDTKIGDSYYDGLLMRRFVKDMTG